MVFDNLRDLPKTYRCRLCDKDRPIAELIVIRRKKTKKILLRPRCKDCHNTRERGHRRKWKRDYLHRWREYNAELNESYWKKRDPEDVNATARRYVRKHHLAILIQGRLRRRLDMHVTIKEAENLLSKFGPCYPTRFGLTPLGLRECERIRSSMRRLAKRLHPVEIRMMVYDDGHFVKPSRQKLPYQSAAKRLRGWQKTRRARPERAAVLQSGS